MNWLVWAKEFLGRLSLPLPHKRNFLFDYLLDKTVGYSELRCSKIAKALRFKTATRDDDDAETNHFKRMTGQKSCRILSIV